MSTHTTSKIRQNRLQTICRDEKSNRTLPPPPPTFASRYQGMGEVPRRAEEVEWDGEEVVVDQTGVHSEEAHHGDHVAREIPYFLMNTRIFQ